MLTKGCTLYCQEQLKSGKDIGFPGWANSSWLVCSLDFPQVEAVRCETDPRRGNLEKGNRHFEKSLTDLPRPTLCQRSELLFAIHAPLFRPPPSALSTPGCMFCFFTAGDRHRCRAWFMICQSALAAASWLAEGEMLWCLAAVGVFLQGQRIPSCGPPLQPFPMGWDVWSCLSSHLVDQNKLREFGVFSLLMPSNVYFFSSQLYHKFWVTLDCVYTVGYLKLWDVQLNLDCSI